MFVVFFYRMPVLLAILYVLHLITYIGLFRKMKIQLGYAVIPFVAEWKMSNVVFKSMRTYYHAMLSSIIFLAGSRYIGTESTMSILFVLFAMFIYWLFLMRMYYFIGRSFGKGVVFCIAAAVIGLPLLWYLGYGPAQFVGGPSKVDNRPKWLQYTLNAAVFLLTAVEFIVLIAGVSFLAIRENPPRILRQEIVNERVSMAAGIRDKGEVVRREQAMDQAAASIEQYRTRDYFAPDHSADENVVVMEYVCATDLESKGGMASVNIAQIADATKSGKGLTFVMQVGGAEYLFTDGMEDGSYARYTINDGKIEKVMDLDSKMCMTEPQNLTDFITWTKENYPADRYMLVFWDHGGGLSDGYGYDELNERADGEMTMPAGDVVEAVRSAGVRFDLIGFDTCLMQDMDVAVGLEPYTDYFLASEEVESGFGWNYTQGFSELAANPGISTEQFGESMIASFDPYNTQLSPSKTPDTGSTLSLIDMTYVRTLSDKIDDLFRKEEVAIIEDSDNYANISLAATGAYKFSGDEQIDLIDYLTRLKGMDYENAIMTEQEMDDLISAVRACIVVRNANSAEGINGLAFSFPVKNLASYNSVHTQLVTLGRKSQRAMYDDFFSIMAYQRKKAAEGSDSYYLRNLMTDYTAQDWYVKGFEDYDTTDTFIDIPLKDTGAGYEAELPEKVWKTISDVQVAVYMHTKDGRLYLGNDHIGSVDEQGRPLIGVDNTWPHVGGALISYNAEVPRVTERGTVFNGTTEALLNGRIPIILHIECAPVADDQEQPAEAYIAGYEIASNPLPFAKKGLESLEAGDTIQFVFDYYDEEGNLIKKEPYGKKVRIFNNKPLTVRDEPLGECDIQFCGMLTDIYERTFVTETMEVHIEK